MRNDLRQKMLNQERTLGMFHEIGNTAIVEMMGYACLDYVVIDTEHGPSEVESTQNYIKATNAANLTPIVRVKDSQRSTILKMLDVGASGIIIPDVRSVKEVEDIVSYGKYFPIGERGVAPTSGSKYWYAEYAQKGLEHLFNVVNRETLIIPQCETKEALENIEEIVKIEGVDGIFVGPYDLSIALGKPGQFEDPEIIEAIQYVLDVCKENQKFSFVYGNSIEDINKKFTQGFDSVTYSMDIIIFGQAIQKIIQQIEW